MFFLSWRDDLNIVFEIGGNYSSTLEVLNLDPLLFLEIVDKLEYIPGITALHFPSIDTGEEWCFTERMDEPFCVTGK